jgi:hypothetical protein
MSLGLSLSLLVLSHEVVKAVVASVAELVLVELVTTLVEVVELVAIAAMCTSLELVMVSVAVAVVVPFPRPPRPVLANDTATVDAPEDKSLPPAPTLLLLEVLRVDMALLAVDWVTAVLPLGATPEPRPPGQKVMVYCVVGQLSLVKACKLASL